MYLGKREYISCDGKLEPVTGVANVPDIEAGLSGKYVFARSVVVRYFFGVLDALICWHEDNFLMLGMIFLLFVANIVLKISFPSSLVCSFRHGREEDEICGVSFNKELVVDRVQVCSCQN